MIEHQAQKLSLSVATLRKANQKRDLDNAIGKIRTLYGFAHLTFLSIGRSAAERTHLVYSTTYPKEWTLLYIQNRYIRLDPVIAIYRTGFQPVDWASLDRSSKEAREFFRQAVQMGVGQNGVTVPVRGPAGARSLVSATSDIPRDEWRRLRSAVNHDLILLSHYMHETFLVVTGKDAHQFGILSRREQECLQLLGRGMVPKRIALNLQLSESAVRLYLGLARRKLNAATIYQAIARASFLEMIDV